MTIGEKIKQQRQSLGLSQRQLCGDRITRNMLSQIENGSARPSMDTLTYLAAQLGQSVSFFLDETALASPNADTMTTARTAYAERSFRETLDILSSYRHPDPVFDAERGHLQNLCLLALAEQAAARGQRPLAMQLLEQIQPKNLYFSPDLKRKQQILSGILPVEDDGELLLRAEIALKQDAPARAIDYLNAAENHDSPRRNLLLGKAYFAQKAYEKAIPCLQNAEKADPQACLLALEICYRETGDFENAYRTACALREL